MNDAASLERTTLEQDQRISETVNREQSRLRNFIGRRVPDPRDVEAVIFLGEACLLCTAA